MRHRMTVAVVVLAAAMLMAATALVAAGCDMPSTGGLGQVGGSGVVVTRQYDFTGFTRVVVDSGFDVEIDYGESYGVQVAVDDNLVREHLEVEIDGDTLHIGLAPLWRYHDITTRARVVMPRLTGLEASGASTVELVGGGFEDVTVDVSGASRVEGGVDGGELAGEVSGGGVLDIAGTASVLRLDASGGSRLDLLDLRAETGDLTLSGGSSGQVTVTGALKVEASGGSRLEYAGDPRVSVDASGGSDVEPY